MFDLKYFQKFFKTQNNFSMTGTDEVGRGPLAGPVVAASVSFHFQAYDEAEFKNLLKDWAQYGINDSKKLSGIKRQLILNKLPFSVFPLMENQIYQYSYSKNLSISIFIKEISPQTIDQINILNASLLAMKEAVFGSSHKAKSGLVLIDGNKKFSNDDSSVQLIPIIKGDSKSLLIGLASIVAKEYRDQLMSKYDDQYPGYHWNKNAGYGTAKHLEAISTLGITEIHRKTFKGVKEFYEEGR